MNKFRLTERYLGTVQAASIDPAFLLRKSGLPPTLFSSGDGVLSTEQLFRLWHTLGELSDGPTVGLKLATVNPWSHPANIAAQHARTFGDGLRHLVRYSTILCWFDHMRIVKSENECIIEFTGPLVNGAAPTILPEHAFARALEIGRRGTQRPLYPLRVELTRTASHHEIYEAHYGCRVRFKARYNAIVFRAGDLELPFATYNAELPATLGPQVDYEIAQLKTQETTSSRAKWVLKRLHCSQHTDIHEVAKELGMSTRTLQRRIAEEGSSFRQLLSDARRELARIYLQHPSLGLSKTASLLGYEDPKSFLRAFRVWEGVTPTEWRARQRRDCSIRPPD
jgi:AraC-like DNA-binding protein